MAREPMPAPRPLESPAVRRSALLAKMLEEQRQPTEIKGGYGELAARLLAQGITQFGANRADKAVKTERETAANTQRQALLAALGGGAPSASPIPAPVSPGPVGQGPALANIISPPAAPVPAQAGPAPIPDPTVPVAGPTMQGVMPPAPAPTPQPAAPTPQANPLGPTPQEIALIRQAAESGDPGQLAWAQQTWGEIQMRMATPPEIKVAVGPDGTTYNENDPASLNRTFANRENINNFIVNTNDPANEGKYFPDLEAGEEPVYDGQGNIVGVRNMSGAIQARGERARTDADASNASRASYAGVTAGAEAAARAPYQFTTVTGPDGQPVTMSASQAAGGVFEGQRPADAIFAEGAARNQVAAQEDLRTRASAGRRALPTLANMEALLPDVIAGFGADQRIAAARALAATGNEDAQRAVAATATFQNEARQLVASILPMFGANPTEGERRYAEQMSGADVSYTPETLRDGIRLARERVARDEAAYGAVQQGQGGSPARPQSRAEFEALPSGTTFIAPDGTTRRKP